MGRPNVTVKRKRSIARILGATVESQAVKSSAALGRFVVWTSFRTKLIFLFIQFFGFHNLCCDKKLLAKE
jgi:hypothetical protein